jgi:hypothetical protein
LLGLLGRIEPPTFTSDVYANALCSNPRQGVTQCNVLNSVFS